MKYFVCSDVHSFYTCWMNALLEAGFNENDDNHKIILCGDLLDRGDETNECYKFALDMCKKGKMIYVKGNHEDCMTKLLAKKYIDHYDHHNRTDKSAYALAGANLIQKHLYYDEYDMDIIDACDKANEKYKLLEPYMVDYFETKNYIFVHSWIPTKIKFSTDEEYKILPESYRPTIDEYMPEGKEANREQGESAIWENPFRMANLRLNQTGKTIVFGHWHTSWQWSREGKGAEGGADACFDPYYGNNFIGIDACTALSNKVNVIVLEDDDA